VDERALLHPSPLLKLKTGPAWRCYCILLLIASCKECSCNGYARPNMPVHYQPDYVLPLPIDLDLT